MATPNEAKTSPTAGLAFQLMALIAQKVSALKLTFEQMKSLVDSPSKLAKLLRCLTGETVVLPPIIYRSPTVDIEPTGFEAYEHLKPDAKEFQGISSFLEHNGKAERWTENYASLEKFAGKVFRCNIHTRQQHFVATLREILDYHGSDAELINQLEERALVWNIFQVFALLQKEIDYGKDPLGLADFKKPANFSEGNNEAWFLVKLKDPVTADCPVLRKKVLKEPIQIGLLSVTWSEFRNAKVWNLRLWKNEGYNFMEHGYAEPTNHFGVDRPTTLFLMNDPRGKKEND